MSQLTPKDLVTYKGGDGLYSGGYKLEGMFMKEGIAPMTTMNNTHGGSGDSKNKNHKHNGGDDKTLSNRFSGLGIPAGLSNLMVMTSKDYYAHNDSDKLSVLGKQGDNSNDYVCIETGLIPETLYEKLLMLANSENEVVNTETTSKNKRKTRRKKIYKNEINTQEKKSKRKTRKH